MYIATQTLLTMLITPRAHVRMESKPALCLSISKDNKPRQVCCEPSLDLR